jgi:hypothetical protein
MTLSTYEGFLFLNLQNQNNDDSRTSKLIELFTGTLTIWILLL